MRSQGIKGPPYKFIYGNTKEILNMKMKSMSSPMDISHDLFPRIQPHIHAWMNLYGTCQFAASFHYKILDFLNLIDMLASYFC